MIEYFQYLLLKTHIIKHHLKDNLTHHNFYTKLRIKSFCNDFKLKTASNLCYILDSLLKFTWATHFSNCMSGIQAFLN